jgi:hypothetical protein
MPVNVNILPAKAAAAITALDNVMLFTDSGDTTQTPFNEAVAQANALNNCVCLFEFTQIITSAELLASNTTPIIIRPTPPVGMAYDVISFFASTDGNFAAPPYATNTVLEVITQGATVAQFTSEFLESTINRTVKFTPNPVVVASNTNMTGGALLLKTFGGDPTTGTYDIRVWGLARLVSI